MPDQKGFISNVVRKQNLCKKYKSKKLRHKIRINAEYNARSADEKQETECTYSAIPDRWCIPNPE
jgi:hypothetical protein